MIEAVRWTGKNKDEIQAFAQGAGVAFVNPPSDVMRTLLFVDTSEGRMLCDTGDWLIKEPFPTADRRFYPCKPDIFEATYEPVESWEE